MPEVSRFFGIIISMYYNDHAPPHFHVRYGRQKALVEIGSLTVLRGTLAPRVLGLVVEWAATHKDDLMGNWELARSDEPLRKIQPLE